MFKLLLSTALIVFSAQAHARSEIDGVWELTEFTLTDNTGKTQRWCEGAYGTIIYTQGYMSVSLNCVGDPKKILLYSGPFSLNGSTVTHAVRNFSDPALKQVFQRSVAMPSENHLILAGPLLNGGRAVVYWTRR